MQKASTWYTNIEKREGISLESMPRSAANLYISLKYRLQKDLCSCQEVWNNLQNRPSREKEEPPQNESSTLTYTPSSQLHFESHKCWVGFNPKGQAWVFSKTPKGVQNPPKGQGLIISPTTLHKCSHITCQTPKSLQKTITPLASKSHQHITQHLAIIFCKKLSSTLKGN